MADNADDVKTEITLEDFNADEQQPAKAEPSPAAKEEPKAPKEKAEAKEIKEEKTDDTAAPPDVPTKTETDSPKADETKVEDKPNEEPQPPAETPTKGEAPTKAEERKTQLNTEIRDLVAQKNALKTEVEKLNAEVYQVATEDELVEGGMTAVEAKVEAMRQERELEKFNERVANAQLTISSESDRVLRDFPIFNPDSQEFDQELAQEAAGHLQSMLVTDPNSNQVIGTNGSIYQYYKTLARASGISSAKGQMQGQKATEQMLANADTGSTAAPEKKVKTKDDELLDLWKSDD